MTILDTSLIFPSKKKNLFFFQLKLLKKFIYIFFCSEKVHYFYVLLSLN